jgi:predicted phage-related endonuclease
MATNLDPIRGQIEILRFVKARKAELKELEDRARAAIEAAMGDAEEGTLDGKVAITWKTAKRRSLDQKALARDHPDLVEEYKTVSPYRRFEVVDEGSDDD